METTLSVRIDKETRDGFGLICREIGITPSAAIQIFIRRMVSERAIPFRVAAPDAFFSDANRAALSRRAAEMGSAKKRKTTKIEDL